MCIMTTDNGLCCKIRIVIYCNHTFMLTRPSVHMYTNWIQINQSVIVWITNNHVKNSTHIFRTAQLNMMNNIHVYCSCYISLTVPRTVTLC